MSAAEPFVDANVLIYLLSADTSKADRAEAALGAGGVVSVQVLNEFASVATRRLRLSIADVRQVLDIVRAVCRVVPLTEETHDLYDAGRQIRVVLYDAMIVAAALLAGCNTLVTEDMQHGQIFERRLRARNPFR